MKSIAFFNNKGGVGKTTLICNIGAYLALKKGAKVLVVDADPQCNTTQLILEEEEIIKLYDSTTDFTIHSIIHPLSIGKGYTGIIEPMIIPEYGFDLIPGDPRLALKEDLLSKDWQDAASGDIRGLRTTFLFSEFLSRCTEYDYVLFDMGPSLGSINRAVLLACDFFISPMSIDIFSLKAIENISEALSEWRKKLGFGLSQVPESLKADIPDTSGFKIQFAGYVAQQYVQKAKLGQKQAVAAYESIMIRIPAQIKKYFSNEKNAAKIKNNFEIGTIPNLYSLIPLSQSAHKPVFSLRAKDGVRGAHFNRVKDAEKLFAAVSNKLLKNVEDLSK